MFVCQKSTDIGGRYVYKSEANIPPHSSRLITKKKIMIRIIHHRTVANKQEKVLDCNS